MEVDEEAVVVVATVCVRARVCWEGGGGWGVAATTREQTLPPIVQGRRKLAAPGPDFCQLRRPGLYSWQPLGTLSLFPVVTPNMTQMPLCM